MKITKKQLKKIIREEIEVMEYPTPKSVSEIIIDHDDPEDVEAQEDAWAGGQNVQSQIDHPKTVGGDPTTRGQEILKIVERKRNIRRLLRKIIRKG